MNQSKCLLLLCSLTFATVAHAQEAPPPAEQEAPLVAEKKAAPVPAKEPPAPAKESPRAREQVAPDAPAEARHASLQEASTLDGATGLLRIKSAGSAAVGTFRLALAANVFSGKKFLCPNCENPQGNVTTKSDHAKLFGTRAQLSVTPLAFLEAYAALRYQSTSNSRGTPEVIPIFGDTSFGAKAFLPEKPERFYAFGGGFNTALLTPTDGVGVKTANLDLFVAGSLDFEKLLPSSKLPLRVHANLGYTFDNSGAIADSIESERQRVLGTARPITRIERFGYGINRVDLFKWGLGVDARFKYVRPFLEWTMDAPVNRQNYICQKRFISAGDRCLARDQTFSALPSRLTIGARGYPWLTPWADGLSVLLAVDIGTGATSNFVEEVTPEAPYSIHFGVGYAFDTQPRVKRIVETKTLAAPAAPLPSNRYYVVGLVVDAETSQPVPLASVFFDGSDENAMLTTAAGRFRSAPLNPGEYRFVVKKDDYLDGQCSAMISGAPTSAPGTGTGSEIEARCELKAAPRVATISGEVRDAVTTEFVANASIVAKDARGRSASVTTDSDGRFRFENVPEGKLRLEVSAGGYLGSASDIELKGRTPLTLQLFLNKRPAQASVVLTKNELKLKRQVHFLFDSSEIQPDSESILEEIAELLRTHSEVQFIEIQGHTDDVGSPEHNLRLSEDRAHAVRDALVRLGVDESRLSARGYGKEKPLVPNVSPQNRARNRRVQLMIQKL
jgi:outer membrane protein OmpA-like peptidoglycan-associated protein